MKAPSQAKVPMLVQRLKDDERKQLGWDIRRNLTKINYRIHTDAIKANLIPPELSKAQTSLVYANEADVLNMALFRRTAKDWRDGTISKRPRKPLPAALVSTLVSYGRGFAR